LAVDLNGVVGESVFQFINALQCWGGYRFFQSGSDGVFRSNVQSIPQPFISRQSRILSSSEEGQSRIIISSHGQCQEVGQDPTIHITPSQPPHQLHLHAILQFHPLNPAIEWIVSSFGFTQHDRQESTRPPSPPPNDQQFLLRQPTLLILPPPLRVKIGIHRRPHSQRGKYSPLFISCGVTAEGIPPLPIAIPFRISTTAIGLFRRRGMGGSAKRVEMG